MKYADWLFKLKSNFGAVDQRYQLESMTTEASSTPRLNATLSCEASSLSIQMYQKLVMTTTGSAVDKLHNAGVNEGFEAWRQFVMEWEPKLVALLMNVLSYRHKDDIPTKLAAFERPIHESQSPEAVDDDTKTGVTVLVMEDMRVKAHPIGNSARIASWTQTREDILEITRTQQYTDSQPGPMQIGAHPKRKGKGKDSKDANGGSKGKNTKNESEKVLLLSEDGSRKVSMRNETERPCRCRRETTDCKLSSERHCSGRSITVLTARRTRDDVSHGDAMCGEKDTM